MNSNGSDKKAFAVYGTVIALLILAQDGSE
jgi:hypothetical protein